MFRVLALCALLPLAAMAVSAEDAPAAPSKDGGDKVMSGMSVVGNDEAPKALVIVPWKSSAQGDVLDVSRALDDGRGPVDRDVFMRELEYYEIRSSSGAPGPGGH